VADDYGHEEEYTHEEQENYNEEEIQQQNAKIEAELKTAQAVRRLSKDEMDDESNVKDLKTHLKNIHGSDNFVKDQKS